MRVRKKRQEPDGHQAPEYRVPEHRLDRGVGSAEVADLEAGHCRGQRGKQGTSATEHRYDRTIGTGDHDDADKPAGDGSPPPRSHVLAKHERRDQYGKKWSRKGERGKFRQGKHLGRRETERSAGHPDQGAKEVAADLPCRKAPEFATRGEPRQHQR